MIELDGPTSWAKRNAKCQIKIDIKINGRVSQSNLKQPVQKEKDRAEQDSNLRAQRAVAFKATRITTLASTQRHDVNEDLCFIMGTIVVSEGVSRKRERNARILRAEFTSDVAVVATS